MSNPYVLKSARDPEIERAIAETGWYQTPISRKELKELARRNDKKAASHFLSWLGLLAASGAAAGVLWPTWWSVPAFLVYGVLYNSADSKWHELSHGTPFTDHRINEGLYRLVSLMTLREPIRWRHSHARHHTHTIIVGHDPEIASQRPPHILLSVLGLWYIRGLIGELRNTVEVALGSVPASVASYVPEAERDALVRWSRIFLTFLAAIPTLCILVGSILPALLVGLPRIYGSFIHYACAFTQHAGLDENVLDHRLNARTIRLNPVLAFLYTNMNFHVEHHMFPMVPFYNLPALHEKIAQDCPPPYCGLGEAYREISRTLWRQRREPTHYAVRALPQGAGRKENLRLSVAA